MEFIPKDFSFSNVDPSKFEQAETFAEAVEGDYTLALTLGALYGADYRMMCRTCRSLSADIAKVKGVLTDPILKQMTELMGEYKDTVGEYGALLPFVEFMLQSMYYDGIEDPSILLMATFLIGMSHGDQHKVK